MLVTRTSSHARTIAVALHGIEPATFERCALIRDWLSDHGIERTTLLVIPARDLHPVGERSPEMIHWLIERREAGDAIAQHGFQHAWQPRGASRVLARGGSGLRLGEFTGLDGEETRRAVHAGWRLLKLAGIEPEGFVAPAYAYTPVLRETLSLRYRWWAELLRVHTADPPLASTARLPLTPAWSFATRGRLRRAASPALVRLGSLLPTDTLRLDIHPVDLGHPRHMLALEWVLARSGPRKAITYEDLATLQQRGHGWGQTSEVRIAA